MTTKLIPIRDKRNGVSALLPEAYLTHPQWAKHFEAVRTTKPLAFTPSEPVKESPKDTEPKKGSK